MKAFLIKVFGFLLLQALLILPFTLFAPPYEHNYLAATLDKEHRLKSTSSPRLVLVGGSNLPFGVKSDLLESALGMPVVNMGLNRKLGLDFMLRQVEPEIRRGDVVVLSLEYEVFAWDRLDLVSVQLLEIDPASLALVPVRHWKTVFDRYGFSIMGGFARRRVVTRFSPEITAGESVYRRDSFDSSGGYVGHFGKTSSPRPFPPQDFLPISGGDIQNLESFARVCRERGARCFFTCPPHPDDRFDRLPPVIQGNLDRISHIAGLELLDRPRDHRYPRELFFDSEYHLTEAGASQRTQKLVHELRQALQVGHAADTRLLGGTAASGPPSVSESSLSLSSLRRPDRP